jgi:Flp pilus assembly pilin Flp
MNALIKFAIDFDVDQEGAAFIEYTALLGVILAVGIAVLATVGQWANARWLSLNTQLSATP